MHLLSFLLLAVAAVHALSARVQSIPGVPFGRDKRQATVASDSLPSFLDDYLPPRADPCTKTNTVTSFRTQTSTRLITVGGAARATTLVTSAVVPTTIYRPTTFYSTVVTTLSQTSVQTVYQTNYVTSTVTQPREVLTVTSIRTQSSRVVTYVSLTRTVTSTVDRTVTQTRFSDVILPTTFYSTRFRTSTTVVFERIPGTTVLVTRTSTTANTVYITGSPQVNTQTRVVTQTQFLTETSRVPGPTRTVVVTNVRTLASTLLSTKFNYITTTVLSTRFTSLVSTTTLTSVRVTGSAVTSVRPIFNTIFSTIRQVATVAITQLPVTRTVTLPASTLQTTVYVTRTQQLPGIEAATKVVTSFRETTRVSTRTIVTAGPTIRVFRTQTTPCEATGYHYPVPRNQLRFG